MDICHSHNLTKPIDIDLLLQTLAGLLNGRRVAARERPEVRREPAHVEPQTARAPAVEQPRPGDGAPAGPPIVSRLASHPKLRAVVRKFALQMPERMSAIEAAWQARDYPTLAGLAHWLKGSGGTAGFDAFTTPARTLEQLAKAADEAAIGAVIAELRSLVDRVVPPAETEDVRSRESARRQERDLCISLRISTWNGRRRRLRRCWIRKRSPSPRRRNPCSSRAPRPSAKPSRPTPSRRSPTSPS
jgi:HPt (histidine-containing phosphotransfer) domain-containing protein